ncbi:phosphoribosylanthranilate isomerase [Arenibacter nanhaiticus]|uniref:N-(5'-phosphoribosyl)anthranilate isomerase n=1 Tax=Arenibacter nanhaiticus TaxID=558155 RepID=A0A1M6HVP0_9FLAO|nr:phosphoribosylanthranilate isomerase [Arenibacter nanhaiticus]SHJ26251.1 phosphoribosylanthranilate isomerase [Arenibacter nanhaiticus]
MKLKVCGMKYHDNMLAVANLQPDYMGYIFWEPSSRYFNGSMPKIPDNIKKVGVFVDASLADIRKTIATYDLQAVQLHGKESPDFCKALSATALGIEIIKVFSIKDDFDFQMLTPYEKVCDYFLFDTKGKLPGGNGYTFSWEVLQDYPSTKPYFLSGGIGLEEADKVADFLNRPESEYCYAIDVNSKFEIKPGEKDIALLKAFKQKI